jgi:hypothetical protein
VRREANREAKAAGEDCGCLSHRFRGELGAFLRIVEPREKKLGIHRGMIYLDVQRINAKGGYKLIGII